MSRQKNKLKKNLAWYWLSIVGTAMGFIGVILGGVVGAMVYLTAVMFFLASLIEAARGGLRGSQKGEHVATNSRVGAFLVALVVAFIILGIFGQMKKTIGV